MQIPPRVGTAHETSFTVESAQTIDLTAGAVPAVLATPFLIWSLEHTALDLMKPYLDDGELTLGVQVELEHLAPTPVGTQVTCRARVFHTEGSVVSFQIEAHDQIEQIAKGLHKRRVVQIDRIRRRVEQKMPS